MSHAWNCCNFRLCFCVHVCRVAGGADNLNGAGVPVYDVDDTAVQPNAAAAADGNAVEDDNQREAMYDLAAQRCNALNNGTSSEYEYGVAASAQAHVRCSGLNNMPHCTGLFSDRFPS
jgi:hypothetical protein